MAEKTTAPVYEDNGIEMSLAEYLENFAEQHYEWVNGVAYKMSPVSAVHDLLVEYLRFLLKAYFSLNPIADMRGDPFLMSIPHVPSRREPDLQIILKTNPGKLTNTEMIGAADICIEVVSPGSVAVDYRDKYSEYEKGGVQEYWLFDPMKRETRFFRLQPSTKLYASMPLDADGNYTTPLLPHFKLHVATVWQDELPDYYAIGEIVKAMFED